MGIHEWSYDNDISPSTSATRCRIATKVEALKDIKAEVELGFDPQLAFKEAAALPELRRPDGVRAASSASSATPASTSARWTASPSPTNGEEEELRTRLNAPALNLTQDLYVSRDLKTGRVMVKDEDVCLHCGLCAERCPTGAWDMQKFFIEMTQAEHACRKHVAAVNDFVVKFANVNGSGSASANELFARSILRMGVPVARATSSRPTSRACRPGTRCASPRRAISAGAAAST